MSNALYGRELYIFTGLSTDSKSPTSDSLAATWSTKPIPGQKAVEFDGGGYTFNGNAWIKDTVQLPDGTSAGQVTAPKLITIQYSDANYNYYCSAAIGSSRTDAAWEVTRISKDAFKIIDYAGVGTLVAVPTALAVAALTYNNGVSV